MSIRRSKHAGRAYGISAASARGRRAGPSRRGRGPARRGPATGRPGPPGPAARGWAGRTSR
ncbi:hypothetical protein GDP17_08890 [Gordonia jinghuaiqii]|nr:hypothetical protein [Gordonia jinghuaiqii]